MELPGVPFDAWITLGVLAVVLSLLVFTRASPDFILFSGLVALMTFGVVDAGDALIGLTNRGMVTVAALYIVAAGFRETGAMALFAPAVLGRPTTVRGAQARIIAPVTAMSAFLNNTPVVAMFIPTITEWARKRGVSVSKLMIPLSYAAILGGMCTLIGTSTNLIINGMLMTYAEDHGLSSFVDGLGMFDISLLGLPCALAGFAYLLVFGRGLLPDRRHFVTNHSDPRSYTVEMRVQPGSALVGKSIEDAGLRNVPGLYLMEIERGGELMVAVGPGERLHADDRLVFVGVVESVVDLQKIPGLKPATDQVFKLDSPRERRVLIEAVVSNSCPLIGRTVREGRFRTRYSAVIIAVARNGEQVRKKIGDIELRAGDTLLLEARPSFVNQQYNSKDFFLVSTVKDSAPLRFGKAWIAVLILTAMVVAASTRMLSMLNAALVAGGAMVATRCCSWTTARRSIDWRVIFVIVSAFGLGRALQVSGASDVLAGGLIGLARDDPRLSLLAVYFITSASTVLITNNAAAVLFFPIAMATATRLGVSHLPFIMATMVAASGSFASPISYQTNLMVYGPGSYRFTDYVRIGVPLSLLLMGIAVSLAPVIWPF